MQSLPETDMRAEAIRLVGAAAGTGLSIRLVGGVAVALRCPIYSALPGLARSYQDIDLVGLRKESGALRALMEDLEYVPDRRFNAVHGATRLVFMDEKTGLQVDVFLDVFKMCHKLNLIDRLAIDSWSLPLADLILTKFQIVHMNTKDIQDSYALLLEHTVGDDESGINARYMACLCASDWGWYTTTMDRITALSSDVPIFVQDPELQSLVRARLAKIQDALEHEPKSGRWRLRSKLGRRVRWYELPEEKSLDLLGKRTLEECAPETREERAPSDAYRG